MVKLSMRVESAEAVRVLDIADRSVRLQLKEAVADAAIRVLAQARANVQGGMVQSRTGKLANSLGATFNERPDSVYAKVGTDWFVGGILGRGFDKQESVRSHLRGMKLGHRFQVMKVSRKGKIKVTKSFEGGAGQVKAYSRHAHQDAVPWLQQALESVRADFYRRVADIARDPLRGA